MAKGSVTLLGAGNMGAALVERWVGAQRPVVLWNRTAQRAQNLQRDGVRAEESVSSAVAGAPVVVTMVTDGAALRTLLIDQGGLAAMDVGATLVDLSTVDVAASEDVARVAGECGVRYLRGAVSGTPAVVRAGAASLLLSGPSDAVTAARPVLNDITSTHAVVGSAEQARVVKIAVNAMLAGTTQLLSEATTLAVAAGVDRSVFLDALDTTVLASKFVTYKGAALREHDYRPTFTATNLAKDMSLAADLSQSTGVALPVGSAVRRLVEASIESGYGEYDFLTLFCVQQAASGLPVDFDPSDGDPDIGPAA